MAVLQLHSYEHSKLLHRVWKGPITGAIWLPPKLLLLLLLLLKVSQAVRRKPSCLEVGKQEDVAHPNLSVARSLKLHLCTA